MLKKISLRQSLKGKDASANAVFKLLYLNTAWMVFKILFSQTTVSRQRVAFKILHWSLYLSCFAFVKKKKLPNMFLIKHFLLSHHVATPTGCTPVVKTHRRLACLAQTMETIEYLCSDSTYETK